MMKNIRIRWVKFPMGFNDSTADGVSEEWAALTDGLLTPGDTHECCECVTPKKEGALKYPAWVPVIWTPSSMWPYNKTVREYNVLLAEPEYGRKGNYIYLPASKWERSTHTNKWKMQALADGTVSID